MTKLAESFATDWVAVLEIIFKSDAALIYEFFATKMQDVANLAAFIDQEPDCAYAISAQQGWE